MNWNKYEYLNAQEVWESMFNSSMNLHDQFCFGLFDHVQIIRCKDCKKRNTNDCPVCRASWEYIKDGEFQWVERTIETNDDFFCAEGELKNETIRRDTVLED